MSDFQATEPTSMRVACIHKTCTLHCTASDNAHSKRYVKIDHITVNVVINSDNGKLIKLTSDLCYFICIACSPNNRATKPKRS